MVGSISDVRLLELTVRTFRNHRNIVADFLLFHCLTSTKTLEISRPVRGSSVSTSAQTCPAVHIQVMEVKACRMIALIVCSNNYQGYSPQ